MAVLQHKKLDFYSKIQALRDEAGAPAYLESAGDVLIKDLAKKQISTVTTLEEQLQLYQEFEKGSDLKPWSGSGVTSLEDFKSTIVQTDIEPEKKFSNSEEYDLDKIKIKTGLSRHELELGLVEKPESKTSKLYRFALQNQRRSNKKEEDLISRLPHHPLNHLKEIEEEAFGCMKNKPGCEKLSQAGKEAKVSARKKKKRKRLRRKRIKNETECTKSCRLEVAESKELIVKKKECSKTSFQKPSLWDVKDMKKFCKNEQQGCRMQRFYTIKDGQIVEIRKENGDDFDDKFGG